MSALPPTNIQSPPKKAKVAPNNNNTPAASVHIPTQIKQAIDTIILKGKDGNEVGEAPWGPGKKQGNLLQQVLKRIHNQPKPPQ